jgi:RimJ/RimL family protein N-acetyltransferase
MELEPPIRTDHLVLRTLTAADATERYLGWMRDPETTRYLESRLAEHSLGSLRTFIESSNASPDSLLLGICLADGRHIGNIKVGPVNEYHRNAAVGLLIGDRDQRGKGYATEAIAAVTAHAFGEMGLHKLFAGCYASNVGSARAFRKAGWTDEGRSRDHWLLGDRREDNVSLGIALADWAEQRR